MERKPVYGDRWSESPLERAGRIGEAVYLRTLARKPVWSPVKQKFYPQEENCSNTTLEEAFTSMAECLHQAAEECHKYHANRELVEGFEDSVEHCQRFHRKKPQPQPWFRSRPFQQEEPIHLILPEGAYAVTAYKPSVGVRQTSIVQVAKTGSQTLHFTL